VNEDVNEQEDVTDLTQEIKAMDNYSVGQMLMELKKAQLKELLAKARIGILTHQEHAVIARLLADNGMVLPDGFGDPKARKTDPSSNETIGAEEEVLPEFNPDEDFE
jgi:hypothetical protein